MSSSPSPPPQLSASPSVIRSNASRAAAIVAATSASPCAIPRNAASNCEGGSQTPSSSIARWNRPNAAVSLLAASVVIRHRPGRKEPSPHRAHAVQRQRHPRPRSLRSHAFRHSPGRRLKLRVHLARMLLQDNQLSQSPPPSPADSRSAFPPDRPVLKAPGDP